MTRLKVWTLILVLCATSLPTHPQEIKGKVIFSVELVEWALERNADGSRGPKKRTGIFFYSEEYAPGMSTITGYKLKDGKVVDLAGEGSVGSGTLLKKINAMSLTSFDVQKEIDATIANQRAEAKKSGKGMFVIMTVTDGAKYRIRYDFNGVSIDHTDWNPGSQISSLAPYSENLRKLNELMDLFATSYGRRQFGL